MQVRIAQDYRRQAGGPIGTYRDKWGALQRENKLAYFPLCRGQICALVDIFGLRMSKNIPVIQLSKYAVV